MSLVRYADESLSKSRCSFPAVTSAAARITLDSERIVLYPLALERAQEPPFPKTPFFPERGSGSVTQDWGPRDCMSHSENELLMYRGPSMKAAELPNGQRSKVSEHPT